MKNRVIGASVDSSHQEDPMPFKRITLLSASCGLFLVLAVVLPSAAAQDSSAEFLSLETGTIIPAGPPLSPPIRVEAGDSCIVDIVLPYLIAGSLDGTAEIDYRIDVKGPCAEAVPGKFDETWIAHGTFTGSPSNASFVYTAEVKAGGKLKGEIVLGQGLSGWLKVSGSLANDHLEYRGFLQLP
jgi:hypothetical protein